MPARWKNARALLWLATVHNGDDVVIEEFDQAMALLAGQWKVSVEHSVVGTPTCRSVSHIGVLTSRLRSTEHGKGGECGAVEVAGAAVAAVAAAVAGPVAWAVAVAVGASLYTGSRGEDDQRVPQDTRLDDQRVPQDTRLDDWMMLGCSVGRVMAA